jgi:alpha-beta hydrolase superfamily lysophospholipase
MTAESIFITSDGLELFTRTVSADSPRYDLLVVHGIAEHCGRWTTVGEQFAAHGAAVHLFDLRGHGLTSGPKGDADSIERFHVDIAEYAATTAAASGRPWVLYGHSLGGMLVAGYLIDGHTPVPSLAVLSAPALDSGVPGALKAVAKVLGSVAGGLRVDSSIRADQLSRDPKVGEAYFDDPLVDTKATLRFGKLILAEMKRLRRRADEIMVPTYVFHGADDELVPPSASAPLAASPAVERHLLAGLRHETHNEPEGSEVVGAVTDWIDRKLN